MSKAERARRYVILIVGLVVNAFGVSFITKAGLGTTPINSIPYSIYLIVNKLTLGNWTIIFNLLYIVLEMILMKMKVRKEEIVVQVALTFLFGYLVDFSMWILQGFQPDNYGIKVISLLIGCLIVGFGVYLETVADVAMLAADAFIRSITVVTGKSFGTVRTMFDVTMVVVAAILCLLFLHKLVGVREGSVVCALLIGNLVKLNSRILVRFRDAILGPYAPPKES